MSTQQTVMIVDDNPSNREICNDILCDDYRIVLAENGTQALELISQSPPDVILLDIVMPDISGLEVAESIRTNPETADIPIIILSGKGMSADITDGLKFAEDYVVKPFDIEELLARVRSMARLKAAQDQVKALNLALENQVETRTQQLVESERLALVGQYAAGVVHNLNGALQKVMSSLELIALRPNDGEKYLDTANQGATEMRSIIATILDKNRNEQRIDVQMVDLNDVVRTQLKFWEADPVFKHGVEKVVQLDDGLRPIRSVYSHWSQSFDNLIQNALSATQTTESPKLTISTQTTSSGDCLIVADNGCGMTEQISKQIFDPFFSTKEKGSGLGLASIRAMLEPYGATISVTSAPGQGSIFVINVPR